MTLAKRSIILALALVAGVGAAPARKTRVFYVPVSATVIDRKLTPDERTSAAEEVGTVSERRGVSPLAARS